MLAWGWACAASKKRAKVGKRGVEAITFSASAYRGLGQTCSSIPLHKANGPEAMIGYEQRNSFQTWAAVAPHPTAIRGGHE